MIIPKPDPVEFLWRHFPELRSSLDDPAEGPYYLYGVFAEHLLGNLSDQQLWQRAYRFFEALATGTGDLPCLLAIGIFESFYPYPEIAARLGPEARRQWQTL